MKWENNSAIHLLSDNNKASIEELINTENANEMRNFIDSFPLLKPYFRQRIQYVCKSFIDSYSSASDKLKEAFEGLSIKQARTFILPSVDNWTKTIFYNIEATYDKKIMIKDCQIFVFANKKNEPNPYLYLATTTKNNLAKTLIREIDLKNATGDPYQSILSDVVGLITFTKYCQVETKMVPPGTVSTYKYERYVNQTKLPVEILDSTWFTTLVRSEGFSVGKESGGFFRWQACGVGLSERRLIWVFPFEKKGYVRRAKILTQNNK